MASTQLPPLEFQDGLRVSLFPPSDASGLSPDAPDFAPHHDGLDDDEGPEAAAHVDGDASPPPSGGIPVHPIPSLQDAFTESLEEATNGSGEEKPQLTAFNVHERREALLDQNKDDEPWGIAWRYRPGQSQHELSKLVAQISFGVYLLLNGMANDNSQAVNILQGHIDEVDEFLEVTIADIDEATQDLDGRIDHLKMPLSNIQAFEEALEDRQFRADILEANEKIDHVLSRTSAAMQQWDDDIESGLQATALFTYWLDGLEDGPWRSERSDVADIFDAMKGNAQGWLQAYDDIHQRAQEVNNLIVRLTTVIAEMEKKAGEVSRKTWAKIPPFSTPSNIGKSMSTYSGSSRASSARPPQLPAPSIHSMSSFGLRTLTLEDEYHAADVPLPVGSPPFLSPTSSTRHVPSGSSASHQSRRHPSVQSNLTSAPSVASRQRDSEGPASPGDESLYVLQPRIYSPQHREQPQMPNALAQARIPPSIVTHHDMAGENGIQRRDSLRQRVARKTSLPEAIHIPPRPMTNASAHGPSAHPTSLMARATSQQLPHDSAYSSDVEARSLRQSSLAGSEQSLSPPATRPQILHSPRSDQQQFYRPVRASPHSPLQQRPHTALGPQMLQPMPHPSVRSPRSQVGSTTSSLSNVTMAPPDHRTSAPVAPASSADRTLKKKKSALGGWFKKAFSLDEEERLQFEARRAMRSPDKYYDANSPKFLDGRRIR
ncbi:hypothetical protein CDD81_364 [Ophiocordyceps australis]|uniref:Karyogamy protein n=1 Tax=Ophiocordyceps australis TaxID=1399860 RepID=A0A2C5Y1A5_9HYPO|nr:hypothetical protein CDD81_364 [Ophiocordyceps australis]